MNKKFLLAGLAFAGLFGGSATQRTTSTEATPVEADLTTSRELASESWPADVQARRTKPAPAKPAAPVTAQRQVAMKAPLAMGPDFTRFVEKPHLRKVKYGKRRWVIV